MKPPPLEKTTASRVRVFQYVDFLFFLYSLILSCLKFHHLLCSVNAGEDKNAASGKDIQKKDGGKYIWICLILIL